MGILDQSNNCSCTSTTCNTTCETTTSTSSCVVSGPSGPSGPSSVSGSSGPSPTPDSGYCCNITPQSSSVSRYNRRRGRR